ncbi:MULTISPECIES: AAA family ATPase [unclassified Chryseobacterium]|uniref:AAA family ATPase n=1 Tax=unclassified Chryseobacterium TaxID=2593645 RepID=UPI00301A45CB
MLEIDSIRIINFKSIKDYTFDFKNISIDSSSTGIFVGLNESGKSAFLEAINFINDSFSSINYEEYCNKEAQDDDLELKLIIKYNINIEEASKFIINSKNIDAPLSKNILIKSFSKTYSSNRKEALNIIDKLDFEIKNIDLNDYYVIAYRDIDSNGVPINENNIRRLHTAEVANRRSTRIDVENVLKRIIIRKIGEEFPKIQLWKSKPEYLISTPIDLNEFKNNPDISIPLKNIFSIYGK